MKKSKAILGTAGALGALALFVLAEFASIKNTEESISLDKHQTTYAAESAQAYVRLPQTNVVATWTDTNAEVLINRYAKGFPSESTLPTFLNRNDNYSNGIVPGDSYVVGYGSNTTSRMFKPKTVN